MSMATNVCENAITQKHKIRKTAVNASRLFELALHALSSNRIDLAKKYFEKAILQGHRLAVRYYILLYREKDHNLARDIILCAEQRALS